MEKKKIRLIARLDVKDVNLVKGIQLEGLRKLGDPNGFAREYYQQGIDELLYIDIVASLYNRNNLSDIVRRTCDEVFIPVTVGGGLRSVEDVRHILSMGADKAAINTAAIKRPELITEVAEAFGSQCMVLSIQAKRSRTWPGKWEAYYDNGRQHSGLDVVEWAKRGVELGAGEILLTSVDNEGLQQGMDLELIEAVTKAVNVPVICGGGVGCETAQFLIEHGVTDVRVMDTKRVGNKMGMLRTMFLDIEYPGETIKKSRGSKITAVGDHEITYAFTNKAKKTVEKARHFDSLVIATGMHSRPTQDLTDACSELGIPCDVIGSAKKVDMGIEATADAYAAAMNV